MRGPLGKSPTAQGDEEQGGRRGLGGQAEGEPGVPQLIPSSPLCSQLDKYLVSQSASVLQSYHDLYFGDS